MRHNTLWNYTTELINVGTWLRLHKSAKQGQGGKQLCVHVRLTEQSDLKKSGGDEWWSTEGNSRVLGTTGMLLRRSSICGRKREPSQTLRNL